MLYPKKAPSVISKDDQSKRLISKHQREELKRVLTEKYQNMYNVEDKAALEQKIDNAIGNTNKITSTQLQNLENSIKNGMAQGNPKATNYNPYGDDDALSVRSGISKMSGASNLNEVDTTNPRKSQPLILESTARPQVSNYKHEEEEWADIYKHNNQYYIEEDRLEKIRQQENKLRFKDELDFQVEQKQKVKEKNDDQKKIDHEQIMMRLEREEAKEKKKILERKEKTMYEKKMRDLQMKEIKNQRKQDLKEHKTLDKILLNQIKEQITKEEANERQKKQQELTMMRKVINDIEENKQRQETFKEKERLEEIELQRKYNELTIQQEQQRAQEFAVKEERIKKIMEAGKEALVQLYDEKLKKQDDKLKHWEEKNERRLQQAELAQKDEAWRRKLETRAYLDQQIEERKYKKMEEKQRSNDQAQYWKNENERYEDFQKSRDEFKRSRQKEYAEELKKQIEEKIEEKKVGNLLLSLREQQWKKKPGFA